MPWTSGRLVKSTTRQYRCTGPVGLVVMIPQYRPIYTPVHVHLVCGSILFPSSGGNSLVAKLSLDLEIFGRAGETGGWRMQDAMMEDRD